MTSNIETTLEFLGLQITAIRNDEIQLNCPAHRERTGHEDANPSLWINAVSGAFICFSCQWKGNIHTLVSYLGGTGIQIEENTVDLLMQKFRDAIAEKPMEEAPVVYESMLEAFKPVPHSACIARGILPTYCRKYSVKWNPGSSSWIIPIRDPWSKKLLGCQEKGHASRFFKNTTGVKKSESLFGYEHFDGPTMIVVESPLDVLRLASVGIGGGVAIYGASMSDYQFNIIRGAQGVIFALDNDEAGQASTSQIRKKALEFGLDCSFFNYDNTDQKDVGGMSRSEIEWGISNAKHILEGVA